MSETTRTEAEPLVEITLHVNGVKHTAAAPTRRLLSDFLRHELRLTGTHVGCEHGVCGACTVLVDGTPMRSCLMFAVTAQDYEITTVEGLAEHVEDSGNGNPNGAITITPTSSGPNPFAKSEPGTKLPGEITARSASTRANPPMISARRLAPG